MCLSPIGKRALERALDRQAKITVLADVGEMCLSPIGALDRQALACLSTIGFVHDWL